MLTAIHWPGEYVVEFNSSTRFSPEVELADNVVVSKEVVGLKVVVTTVFVVGLMPKEK